MRGWKSFDASIDKKATSNVAAKHGELQSDGSRKPTSGDDQCGVLALNTVSKP
jgi:hypothetical protein